MYASKWFRRDITAIAEEDTEGFARLSDYADQLCVLLDMASKKRITNAVVKDLLKLLTKQFVDIEKYIKEQGLELNYDIFSFEGVINDAIATSPEAVADVKAGKEKALNAIVGKVMQATKGKAQPDRIKAIILKKLQETP